MERHGEETHLNSTEASGGVKNHGVRYVLMFSLLLAIALLSLIWISGSYFATSDDGKPHQIQGVAVETG
jgi:hypothetical protein